MWWLGSPAKDTPVDYDEPVHVAQYSGDLRLWDDYIDKHPAGTIYHRSDWRKVIELTFGFECPYLVAMSGSAIVGVLPLTVVKSPFFGTYITSSAFADFGGVCADDQNSARMLIDTAFNVANKVRARSLELRHVLPANVNNLNTHRNKVLSVLKLSDSEENLLKLFGAKLRNQIRKSMKNGMSARWGHEDLLPDFYSVFLRNMRDLGTPSLGIDFFKNLVKFHGEAADVLVIYKENIPVSGAVALSYRNTMEVPWASSNRQYFSLLPNNYLYWTLLKKCITRELDYFSFGRSTVDSSTYKFKAQWNSESIILNYQSIAFDKVSHVDLTPKNPKYSLAIRAWQKLPIALAKRIGPVVAKGLA
jgi:FemAB-related protein (PEP-CTERM system-associated)